MKSGKLRNLACGAAPALAIVAALALFPAQSFAASILYGITFDDNLLQITVGASSVSATVIGPLDTVPNGGSASLGIGLLNGNLYVYDQDAQLLREVSSVNAHTIATFNLGLTNTGEGDLAFAPNGTGYLVSTVHNDGSFDGTGAFYSFPTSPSIGSAVTITNAQSAFFDGLTFDASGKAYGLEQGGGELDSLSTASGAVTAIGATGITTDCGGFPCYSLGGLAFSGTTLYGALSSFGGTTNFYTINTSTGAATLLGNLGYEISGITGVASIAVSPEPSTVLLILGGGFAMFMRAAEWRDKSINGLQAVQNQFRGDNKPMAEPFLGEIRLFGFNFAPVGWQMCNGQLLSIQQNVALFSLLGTNYGGNGTSTFALPDLRGRVPIHQGTGLGLSTYVMGEVLGQESVTLLTPEIPAHSHLVNASASKGNQASPIGHLPAADAAGITAEYTAAAATGQMSPTMIGTSGGSQPHENRQPLLVMNWCIAMQGIFPSRN